MPERGRRKRGSEERSRWRVLRMYVRVVLLDQQIPGRRAGGKVERLTAGPFAFFLSIRVLLYFLSFLFSPPPFPSELRPDPAFISLHRALLLLLITRGKKISTIFEMRTTFFQKLSKIDLRKKERKEIGIRNCPRLTEKDERRESKDRKIAKRKREREKKEKHRRHRVGHSLSALIDIISSHLTKKT